MQSFFIRNLFLLALLLLMQDVAVAKVRVVATIPSLAALASEVGGQHVSVRNLAPPTADPHFVDGRPSFVVALSKADLLIHVGLDLEVGWLPPLVQNARNRKIQPGNPGNLDGSTIAGPLIGVTRDTDRSKGDVHAGGNPHYLMDPRMAVNVAIGITKRLIQIDPDNAEGYKAQAINFKKRMQARISTWKTRLAKAQGTPLVSYHQSTVYLSRWLGMRAIANIEPLPGIQPTPGHLAKVIVTMRRERAKIILSEPWYYAKTARMVAEKAGGTLIRLPGDVGVAGINSYADYMERIVSELEKAL